MYERQAYERDGRCAFWGGLAVGVVDGGRGLIDQHAAAAERHGIEVRHDAPVEELVPGGACVRSPDGGATTLRARAVVLAAGGFESNPALRARYLGPNWDVAKVRGTPYNTGEVLRAALGARRRSRTGTGAAATRSSGTRDAPPTGDLELTNRFSRQSYPVGIVVNADGERFVDEGADFRNYTYAKYGAEVLRQPVGRRVPALRRRAPSRCCATIDYEAPGATRVEADTLGELGRGAGDRRRALRAHGRASSTPRSRPATVRPGGQGRAAHRRARGRRSPTGRCRSTRRRSSPSR